MVVVDHLAINDRVTRPGQSVSDPLRHGVVVAVYRAAANGLRLATTLYAVQWADTGRVERGYLRVGLTRGA